MASTTNLFSGGPPANSLFGDNPPAIKPKPMDKRIDCSICAGSNLFRKSIVICEQCFGKQKSITFLKTTFQMVEKKEYDQIAGLLKAHQETRYFQFFQSREVLSAFLTKKVAANLEQYNNFITKIQKEHKELADHAKKSGTHVLEKVEKQLTEMLTEEVNAFYTTLRDENEQCFKKSRLTEAFRNKIESERSQLGQENSNQDEFQSNGDKDDGKNVTAYEKEMTSQVMDLLDGNIDKIRKENEVLAKLSEQADNLRRQLGKSLEKNQDAEISK